MAWNRQKPEIERKQNSRSRQGNRIVWPITLILFVTAIFSIFFCCQNKNEREQNLEYSPKPKISAEIPKRCDNKVGVPNVEIVSNTCNSLYRQPTNPNLPKKKWFPSEEDIAKARLGKDGKPKTKSIYKTPLEQSLGILFSTKLGSPPPMLPDIGLISGKAELEKFFSASFEYDKNAPNELNENRILMQQVRDEFKRYLEKGGLPSEFVNYYRGELQTAHEEWKTAQRLLMEMCRNGEPPDSLRAFRDKANQILADRGIKPIAVPPAYREVIEQH